MSCRKSGTLRKRKQGRSVIITLECISMGFEHKELLTFE